MLMLDASKEISRTDLASIPTPAPTRSWCPVAHHEVAGTLIDRAGARGLKVRSERWSVMPGALYPSPGVRVELKGARLFGAIDFEPIDGIAFPDGCVPSAGVRNSHDKSFALSVLSGARVLICANGILSAEHIVKRRHTSGIDLPQAIDDALDAFMESVKGFGETYNRLREKRLSRTKAHSLVVEMARAGAFSSAHILPIVETFENPRHEAFKDRTAWSLHNACTEIMKRQSPARQVDGLKSLNGVLLAA